MSKQRTLLPVCALAILNRLWLRGLLRAGKVQRNQAARLLKRLLVKPKPKIRAKPKLRPGKPAGRVGGRNPGGAYEIRDFYLRKKLLLSSLRQD